MPHRRSEEEPPHEETGNAVHVEGAKEQEQDAPRGHGGETFMEHPKGATDEQA